MLKASLNPIKLNLAGRGRVWAAGSFQISLLSIISSTGEGPLDPKIFEDCKMFVRVSVAFQVFD